MSRPVRDVVVVALALGGIAPLLLAGCGGTSSDGTSSARPAGLPPEESLQQQDRAAAAARRFLDRYVTPDGRVRRIDQGGDTVGEGQAYGMLLAAAIGDSQRFDSIWAWTKNNLRRPDGLISFLWRDGRVQDPAGGLRRRPGRQPRATRRRLPLPAPRPATGSASVGGRHHAAGGRFVPGAPRC